MGTEDMIIGYVRSKMKYKRYYTPEEVLNILQDAFRSRKRQRLFQYYASGKDIISFASNGNPGRTCKCGSKRYHKEYDRADGAVYRVCDGCGEDLSVIRSKSGVDLELSVGIWK